MNEILITAAAISFIAFVAVYLAFVAIYHTVLDISERIDAIWGEVVDDEFGDLL